MCVLEVDSDGRVVACWPNGSFVMSKVLVCVGIDHLEGRPCLTSFGFLAPYLAIVYINTSLKPYFVPNTHSLFVRVLVVSKSDSVIDLLIERLDRLIRVIRRS